MPSRNSSLDNLRARKSLLLLEADIHRAQLRQEWTDLKGSFHSIGEKTKPARSLFAVAGLVLAGLTAFRRMRRGHDAKDSKESMVPPLLKLLTGALLPLFLRFVSRSQAR